MFARCQGDSSCRVEVEQDGEPRDRDALCAPLIPHSREFEGKDPIFCGQIVLCVDGPIEDTVSISLERIPRGWTYLGNMTFRSFRIRFDTLQANLKVL